MSGGVYEATDDIEIRTIGFRGSIFSNFYAGRSKGDGPGWYVFGLNPAYGGHYTMLCARPAGEPVRMRGYNGKVRPGWRRRKDADKVARELNKRAKDAEALVIDYTGELHGTDFR